MVCSPVSNTLTKSASSWTAACSGASLPGISASRAPMTRLSMPGEPAAYFGASGVEASAARKRESGMWRRDERGLRGTNLCAQRFEQRIQDDQGRSVFEHLFEDMSAPAPATAHVGVTRTGGVSGPYPWRRRPV
ncbi:hypothetical protein SAMN06265355_110246 [Actinomadura mexicana]|uniref:Uncharacterized protein n=1 Tax=Actinomadura mexicana TaxID=134959 RepID=A0A239BJ89_9ACTN|nr:hypothetical protein SAMN06265355_110246 [Actinomadura mexicana]